MKPRYTQREIVFLVVAGMAALIMLAAFIAMNVTVVRSLGRGGDFLLAWKGTRAVLFEKGDPYSGSTAAFVQEQVYGRSAHADEKPYVLTTPFFILLLYFPTGLFADASIPAGVFLFLSEAALLTLIFLGIRLTDWQPRRMFTAALFLFLALSLYSLWALIEASPAILLGLIFAAILGSLRLELDELAGSLIAISLYRWEIGGLFLLLILLWVLAHRRWRVLSGLFMALFVLVVISFLVYPGWVMPFLQASLTDAKWNYGFTPGRILAGLWPQYGRQAGTALGILMAVLLVVEWTGARHDEARRFYWAACLSLAAAPLIGWRGEIQNLVVLLMPLIFILAVVRERWKAGYWLSSLLLLLIMGLPWSFMLSGAFPDSLRQELAYLFLPVFTVLGLYWTRWWALRPSRTLFEHISSGEYR